jgi:hypothetical protein
MPGVKSTERDKTARVISSRESSDKFDRNCRAGRIERIPRARGAAQLTTLYRHASDF